MTLLNAPEYDPRRGRRKMELVGAGLLFLVLVGLLTYRFWYWHEERTVDAFFSRLEQKDYEGAYAIWMADPQWKQHPQQSDTNGPRRAPVKPVYHRAPCLRKLCASRMITPAFAIAQTRRK